MWSTNTAGKGVTAMEMQDGGNLVLIGNDSKPVWQSFSYPSDTLLSNQIFFDGMRLVSDSNPKNLSFYLEMKSGNVILHGAYKTPQPYWSLANDARKIINQNGVITSASLVSNSWRFFNQNQTLIYQFLFSGYSGSNVIWAAVLGYDGLVSFYGLENWGGSESIKIPEDKCSTPEPCAAYGICYTDTRCGCPLVLSTELTCQPKIVPSCNSSKTSVRFILLEDELDYFALGFFAPSPNFDLNGCMDACLNNCSCLVIFFENKSQNCFLIDKIRGLRWNSQQRYSKVLSYIKVFNDGGKKSSSKKHLLVILISTIAATILFSSVCLLCFGVWYNSRKRRVFESFKDVLGDDDISLRDALEENNFLENQSWAPTRFAYKDLLIATNNFSVKLGKGGFGLVYKGMLQDGTQIAVKKLEGISRGRKEFQAELNTIGSIHRVHLVKLKGFCLEGTHQLLAYEYMPNGSLDRWIFRDDTKGKTLDWEKRFRIALGMAKGLPYLHEGCNVKIIHCDIKPENVLLDENYQARVSDFGLAKLMAREQSRVVTVMRGTRGYLAPEWITINAYLGKK